MVEVKKYHLPPTALIPNSPHPLLHYPGLLSSKSDCNPAKVYDLFTGNGWEVQWIYRYGQTQTSHYHSGIHECMAVLSGTATIRFGVADTTSDLEANTYGGSKEDGGIELGAKAGDVFILPAGTAHKTFDTKPSLEFKLLTPGNGHFIEGEDTKRALANMELSGFTMIGAYPTNSGTWDFAIGGDSQGEYERVWATPKPDNDPVLGKAAEGLCGLWN